MTTSSQGKAIARLNALKTGARSPMVPLPHEAADFAEFVCPGLPLRTSHPTKAPPSGS